MTAGTAIATWPCVVRPVARHAALSPMIHSKYCGLSTGLTTRKSNVAASGASAANSGRHRPWPDATRSRQHSTASPASTRPIRQASMTAAEYGPSS